MDIASLVLRLALGAIFLGHGAQKAFGAFSGPGIKGFSGMLASLGFAPPILWAYLAAYTELVCGGLLVAGVLTRPSATLLLVLMLVATYKVHLRKGFFLSGGGFEYNLLIVATCIAVIIMGGGKFSLIPGF